MQQNDRLHKDIGFIFYVTECTVFKEKNAHVWCSDNVVLIFTRVFFHNQTMKSANALLLFIKRVQWKFCIFNGVCHLQLLWQTVRQLMVSVIIEEKSLATAVFTVISHIFLFQSWGQVWITMQILSARFCCVCYHCHFQHWQQRQHWRCCFSLKYVKRLNRDTLSLLLG